MSEEKKELLDKELILGTEVAAMGNFINDKNVNYVDQNKYLSQSQSHGIIAEHVNHRLDKLLLKNAEHIGGDNIKNGADRIVNGTEVQTKFYNNPTSTLNSAFENDQYKYISSNGKPMVLEVPKDQYKEVIKKMEDKIRDGKVPGIKNPEQASELVKSSPIKYNTARSIAKAGTIKSITYDVTTGAIRAFKGSTLSAVVAIAVNYLKTGDAEESIKKGAKVGGELFLVQVTTSVIQDQLIRTEVGKQILNNLGVNATPLIGAGVFLGYEIFKNQLAVINGNLHPKTALKNIAKKGTAMAGALAGAKIGATLGGGVPGAFIGGAIGGLTGALAGEKMFGYKKKDIEYNLTRLHEEIENILNSLDYVELNNVDMDAIRDYVLSEKGISFLMEDYENFKDEILGRILSESSNFSEFEENEIFIEDLEEKVLLEKENYISEITKASLEDVKLIEDKYFELEKELELKLDF